MMKVLNVIDHSNILCFEYPPKWKKCTYIVSWLNVSRVDSKSNKITQKDFSNYNGMRVAEAFYIMLNPFALNRKEDLNIHPTWTIYLNNHIWPYLISIYIISSPLTKHWHWHSHITWYCLHQKYSSLFPLYYLYSCLFNSAIYLLWRCGLH